MAKLKETREAQPGAYDLATLDFEVGKRYPLPIPRGHGAHLSIDHTGFLFSIFESRPTPNVLESIQGEPLEMRLQVAAHTLFFHLRTGGNQWLTIATMEASRNTDGMLIPWRVAGGHALYQGPGPGGMALQVCIVDSDTNTLRGKRVTTLSRTFCTAVLAACREILDRPRDDDAHAREVDAHEEIPMEEAAELATIRFTTASKN